MGLETSLETEIKSRDSITASDFWGDFLQGMCSKIGCVISNISDRFFRKTIDYVNRCVKIFTDRTNFPISISYLFHICAF